MDGNDSHLSGWYILACIYMTVVIIISVLVVRITHRPQCRDISGTFFTLSGAKFEISSRKAHKTIKKVRRKYEVALVNSSFMSALFSLPVTIHMDFEEEKLIKQM